MHLVMSYVLCMNSCCAYLPQTNFVWYTLLEITFKYFTTTLVSLSKSLIKCSLSHANGLTATVVGSLVE